MYLFPKMIELGLKKDQSFSDDQRIVAETLIIGNRNIKNIDDLFEVVQIVLKIPEDRIRFITLQELINEFDLYEGLIY